MQKIKSFPIKQYKKSIRWNKFSTGNSWSLVKMYICFHYASFRGHLECRFGDSAKAVSLNIRKNLEINWTKISSKLYTWHVGCSYDKHAGRSKNTYTIKFHSKNISFFKVHLWITRKQVWQPCRIFSAQNPKPMKKVTNFESVFSSICSTKQEECYFDNRDKTFVEVRNFSKNTIFLVKFFFPSNVPQDR